MGRFKVVRSFRHLCSRLGQRTSKATRWFTFNSVATPSLVIKTEVIPIGKSWSKSALSPWALLIGVIRSCLFAVIIIPRIILEVSIVVILRKAIVSKVSTRTSSRPSVYSIRDFVYASV